MIAGLPGLPRDAEGPVFAEPWEAQAFAIAVRLHEGGCFTWPEWATALATEIAAAPDRAYYRSWLAALERLLAEKGLASPDEIARRAAALSQGSDHDHDHGPDHDGHGHG